MVIHLDSNILCQHYPQNIQHVSNYIEDLSENELKKENILARAFSKTQMIDIVSISMTAINLCTI